MKKIYTLLLPLFAAFVVFSSASSAQKSAEAEPRLTVIELFTSQGCSSCPPADSVLKTMRDRPGILTLSWAVDYWDRLGWEDTFATPYNSMRQTAYNKRFGLGGVFTPQMVFDGRLECVGSKVDEVRDGLVKARKIKRTHISPVIKQGTDSIVVSLPASEKLDMVSIRAVWYQADATVEIGDGENQGRTLHYTNVVRKTELLGDWDGTEETRNITIAAPDGADHIAILLQEEYGHGPIVGAASLDLNTTE